MILNTPHLTLRQFLPEDALFLFELNSDPDVIRYTGDKPFKDIDDARTLILNYDQYEKYNCGRLTVMLNETQELLGWCGLRRNAETGNTDLGFRFKKKYWNKGYATEASLACIEYGFTELNLPVIYATAMKENAASAKVLMKTGMKYWKDIVEHGDVCVVYRIEKVG